MPDYQNLLVEPFHPTENIPSSLFLTDLYFLIVQPRWEQLLFIWIFLLSLDYAFSVVEHLFRINQYSNCVAVSPIRMNVRTCLCASCSVIICLSILPVPLLWDSSLVHWLLASSIFLILTDFEIFLTAWQVSFLCVPNEFTQLSCISSVKSVTDQPSSIGISDCSQKPPLPDNLLQTLFSSDYTVNFLLKLTVSAALTTSGYDTLDTTCRILVLQQLLYMLCLISYILLLSALNLHHHRTSASKPFSYAQRLHHSDSVQLSAASPTPSHSFSGHPTGLLERLHLYINSTLQSRDSAHRFASVPAQMKFLPLIVLILLCMHHCYPSLTEKLSFSFISDLFCSSNHSISNFTLHQPTFPHILNRSALNLFLFILAGILLYQRAKCCCAQRSQALKLHLLTNRGEKDVSTTLTSSSSDSSTHTRSLLRQQLIGTEEFIMTANNADGNLDSGQLRFHGLNASDEQILSQLSSGQLKTRDLETLTGNPNKGVELRRLDLCRLLSNSHVLDRLPFRDYDYRFVCGQCCEEVIGYVPIPTGKVGPLLLDGRSHYLPLATTEGCLVASTNRGCRALFLAGGVKSAVFRDQMTRAPVVWFPSVLQVVECIAWIESDEGFQQLKTIFDGTSAYVNLLSIFPNPSGHYLHIRFAARTGDAMGMNMVSKATSAALGELRRHFPAMQVLSLSGNMCTDKKPAFINTILGRGKSVIAEANLPATVVAEILHTTASRLTKLAHAKNWTGSTAAGCLGMAGSNAHAANIVAGIFAATGQDLAQVVDASACLTQFEVGPDDSLIASVTMPCLEVGTIGGGTRLPAQRACLDLMNLSVDRPTEHLARLIAGAVLAGELSLMSALDTDDLVSAHMRLNRAPPLSTCCEPFRLPTDISLPRDVAHATIVKSDASGRLDPPHPIM